MTGSARLAALCIAVIAPFLASAIGGDALARAPAPAAQNNLPPLQITHRTGLRVVVQVNSAETMPNGVGKQVMGAKNLYDQYLAQGMTPGKDFEIVLVFRADGAQFLLTDAAYDLKVKAPHPAGNPSRAILDSLHEGGVSLYECGVAMKMKGYEASDILPYGRVVASGIAAIVDLEKSGYLSITP
ncbi:MAG: DsrE family protein [Caulobacter sp.]|nr:DsrE family protein [Caulobacter sp.]